MAGTVRETVREGNRMLLKERKLGDPRIDSGCKEFARSMVTGDIGTVAIDATDGRRAICIPNQIRATVGADASRNGIT